MPNPIPTPSPIDRHLNLFGEIVERTLSSSTVTHRDLEELPCVGLNLYNMIQMWENEPIGASKGTMGNDDLTHRPRYVKWLKVSRRVVQAFRDGGGSEVTRSFACSDFCENVSAVEVMLEEWKTELS